MDMQVISATPVLFAYERPAEHALDCARLFNDAALELCCAGQWPVEVSVPGSAAGHRRCVQGDHALQAVRGMSACRSAITWARRIWTILASSHSCIIARMKALPVLVHPWDMLGEAAHAELHDALDSRDARRNATRDRGDDTGRGIRQTAQDFANLLCPWRRKFRVSPRTLAECMAASSGGAWRMRVVARADI